MKKSDFTAIANENKKVNTTTANVDLSVIENSAKDLTDSERLNAYLANHAVEHYCAALNADSNEIENTLQECEKESGVYWLYTAPKFDADHKKEDCEKQNSSAIFVANLGGQDWFKRPFVIGDARGVRSIVNAYNRYNSECENAEKRTQKKAAAGLDAIRLLAEREGLTIIEYIEKYMG